MASQKGKRKKGFKTMKSKDLKIMDMQGLDIQDGKVVEYDGVPATDRNDGENVKVNLDLGLATMMKQINIKKETEKTEKIISEYQENLNKVVVRTGCCWDFYRTIARNASCVVYFLVIIIIVLAIVLRPPEEPFFENKDYTPIPEDFTFIEEFIHHQKLDPSDPYGMTLLLELERFDRDGLKRRMQKNFFKDLYPLYGGYVLDPIRRKIIT